MLLTFIKFNLTYQLYATNKYTTIGVAARAFGISMGIAGHAIMWKGMRNAEFVKSRMDVEVVDILNSICFYLSASVAGFVAICYLYKIYTSFLLVKNEYLNEVRCHFFNAPNVIFIMLLIGLPVHIRCSNESETFCVYVLSEFLVDCRTQFLFILPALRILWALAFCYQVLMTQFIYKAWMFSKRRNFTGKWEGRRCSGYGWNS